MQAQGSLGLPHRPVKGANCTYAPPILRQGGHRVAVPAHDKKQMQGPHWSHESACHDGCQVVPSLRKVSVAQQQLSGGQMSLEGHGAGQAGHVLQRQTLQHSNRGQPETPLRTPLNHLGGDPRAFVGTQGFSPCPGVGICGQAPLQPASSVQDVHRRCRTGDPAEVFAQHADGLLGFFTACRRLRCTQGTLKPGG